MNFFLRTKVRTDSRREIPTPTFRESEMRKCQCCTPAKRTIITLDPQGYEQYLCPRSGITMRVVGEAFKYRLNPNAPADVHTYVAGQAPRIVLP